VVAEESAEMVGAAAVVATGDTVDTRSEGAASTTTAHTALLEVLHRAASADAEQTVATEDPAAEAGSVATVESEVTEGDLEMEVASTSGQLMEPSQM